MVLLTAQNLGSAMADVVVDAMIAEAVRFEKYVNQTCLFYLKIELKVYSLILSMKNPVLKVAQSHNVSWYAMAKSY